MAKYRTGLVKTINATLSKSILCIYHAEIMWRQEAVNRPLYGCAIVEGRFAFYFLKRISEAVWLIGQKKS
jgi:hypothetical protein